jgi:hypothetical protein
MEPNGTIRSVQYIVFNYFGTGRTLLVYYLSNDTSDLTNLIKARLVEFNSDNGYAAAKPGFNVFEVTNGIYTKLD